MTEADSAVSDGTGSPVPAHAEALVLGGGPCGLYAALTLARAGKKVVLLEKEEVPGGLARGHRRGNNYYDLGVHMLHAFDPEVFETIKGIMGDERVEVPLNALIKWAGSFYRYPLQFGDMVKGMNKVVLLKCCLGLLAYQFRFKVRPREPQNAEEALIQLYGRPLYRFFFREFTHRYWGFPPTQLSATFITTKMPRLSAVDVIKKALAKIGVKDRTVRAVESALSEEILHYSRNGAEAMPRLLVAEIERMGCRVVTNAEVRGVVTDPDTNRVTGVTWRDPRVEGDGGAVHRLTCDLVVATIPVGQLVTAFDDAAPATVREAAASLRTKPIAIYGLLVNKPRAIDALYIYYRNKYFHRVGEPKNAGLIVDPPDHTVLIVEMTCEIGDAKWNGDPEAMDAVAADLEAEGLCTRDQIVETHVLRTPHGYPIFDLGFEKHLGAVQSFLDGFANIVSTGRQGGFCYPNMHKAMRMGADAATAVLERTGTEARFARPDRVDSMT
ncbi:MAG: FAD-dependent oxidoreductase [Verrucomicrobiae bacterium]|nr:FAD-dependent oxidoreductase [Verrucomicrobiae bacterium]MCP5538707.1 FAD-dependent oxidoreductase [Akkermansiaceae bacterium]